jgi:hypothetical protein
MNEKCSFTALDDIDVINQKLKIQIIVMMEIILVFQVALILYIKYDLEHQDANHVK